MRAGAWSTTAISTLPGSVGSGHAASPTHCPTTTRPFVDAHRPRTMLCATLCTKPPARTYVAPGASGSGPNSASRFQPRSVGNCEIASRSSDSNCHRSSGELTPPGKRQPIPRMAIGSLGSCLSAACRRVSPGPVAVHPDCAHSRCSVAISHQAFVRRARSWRVRGEPGANLRTSACSLTPGSGSGWINGRCLVPRPKTWRGRLASSGARRCVCILPAEPQRVLLRLGQRRSGLHR